MNTSIKIRGSVVSGSQVGNSAGRNIVNGISGHASPDGAEKDEAEGRKSYAGSVWKNIPVVNAIVQIIKFAFHL